MGRLKKDSNVVKSALPDSKSILKNLAKHLGNEYAVIPSDDELISDCNEYIDTGSYTVNLALSGSVFKGQVTNRITGFAGEPSTGKTFLMLGVARNFLQAYPESCIVLFDSEAAISRNLLTTFNIPLDRVLYVPVNTAEDFGKQAMSIVNSQLEEKPEDRLKLMFILDSLGQLSSNKLKEDMIEGKDVADMTKAKKLKGIFNTLTMNLAKLQIPMLVSNHLYDVIGSFIPMKEQGGGRGMKFSASTICFLTKAQNKEDGKKNGSIVTLKIEKGRFTREGSSVKTRILHESGLDRYFGLLDLCEEHGVFRKEGLNYFFGEELIGRESAILKNPDKVFTQEILEKIDEVIGPKFLYGVSSKIEEDLKDEQDEEDFDE